MRRAILPLMLLAGVFACQNYDFHHITPTPVTIVHTDASISAAPGTPYIMILEDMSGSMCEPISADGGVTDSGLHAGDCSSDPINGSKIGLVAQNLSAVLASLPSTLDGGNPYYLGLTTFPLFADAGTDAGTTTVAGCFPPTGPQVPVGLASTTIPLIDEYYGNAVSLISGGTPTAAALQAAGSFLIASDTATGPSQKYLLLLTDGLPNCNVLDPCVVDNTNPIYQWSDGQYHGCMSTDGWEVQHTLPQGTLPPDGGGGFTQPGGTSICQCSYGSCPNPTGPGANEQCCFADPIISAPGQDYFNVAAAECLDGDHTIQVASSLYAQGVKIFVIGMGEDFNDFSLLDQIAQAGQGNPAAVHFQADDEMSLYNAIDSILVQITSSCTFSVSPAPASGNLIEVILDSTTLVYGTDFTFSSGVGGDGGGGATITLTGSACTTIDNGQPHNLTITALGGN